MQETPGASDLIGRLPVTALAVMLLALPTAVMAVEQVTRLQVVAPIDPDDYGSLQRGAGMFVNYCMGCHSMRHVRYSRVAADLGINEDNALRHLTFGKKLFSPILSSLSAEHSLFFNGAEPPDLSLIGRVRGADWLYSFLRGFYRDAERPSGWNNLMFASVAMPNALQSLQGTYRMGDNNILEPVAPGRMERAEFDVAVADLVNFLVYSGDPTRRERLQIGYAVMIFILLLLPLSYVVYREYWRDIK